MNTYNGKGYFLYKFLDQCCTSGTDCTVGTAELHREYQAWITLFDHAPELHVTQIKRQLLERGYHTDDARRVYIGIALKK